MVNGNQQLPDGWKQTTIGETLKIVRGISFPKDAKTFEPKKGYIACLRTTNVQQEVEWDDLWFVPTENVKREEQLIQPNDILISTANSLELVGKVAQIKNIPHKATLGAFISLIRVPVELNPKFVYFQLASTKVQSEIRKKASTTTNISNISTSKLAEIDFDYPSLPEQERIVAKIEELFTQLEAGTSALERVQAGLRRYKASVLKAAVEGRLLPSGHGDAVSVPGELPEGWRWTTVGELSRKIQYGTSEKADLDSAGIPVLRMGNIQEGQLDFNNLKYLPEDAPGVKDLVLDEGDLIFNRTNSAELVGKTAVYKSHHPRATFASYLIRAKLDDTTLPDYVSYYINSWYGRQYIASVVSQQVGQANVNGTKLANMPIPLPPLEEQRRIVAEVERRLSVAREVESVVEKALARSTRLRQSVLKSAFEGRLVR